MICLKLVRSTFTANPPGTYRPPSSLREFTRHDDDVVPRADMSCPHVTVSCRLARDDADVRDVPRELSDLCSPTRLALESLRARGAQGATSAWAMEA
jgi:hypothetical protein